MKYAMMMDSGRENPRDNTKIMMMNNDEKQK